MELLSAKTNHIIISLKLRFSWLDESFIPPKGASDKNKTKETHIENMKKVIKQTTAFTLLPACIPAFTVSAFAPSFFCKKIPGLPGREGGVRSENLQERALAALVGPLFPSGDTSVPGSCLG